MNRSLRLILLLLLACLSLLGIGTMIVRPKLQLRHAITALRLYDDHVTVHPTASVWVNRLADSLFPPDPKNHYPLFIQVTNINLLDAAFDKRIDDHAMPLIARFRDVPTIAIPATPVTDAGLSHLAHMPNLRRLDIHMTRITDGAMSTIATLEHLQSLDLGDTAITDAAMETIARLRDLQHLSLWQTAVTDRGVRQLAMLANLQSLDLTQTAVTDASVPVLIGMGSLQSVGLKKTAVTPAAITQLRAARPKLHINY